MRGFFKWSAVGFSPIFWFILAWKMTSYDKWPEKITCQQACQHDGWTRQPQKSLAQDIGLWDLIRPGFDLHVYWSSHWAHYIGFWQFLLKACGIKTLLWTKVRVWYISICWSKVYSLQLSIRITYLGNIMLAFIALGMLFSADNLSYLPYFCSKHRLWMLIRTASRWF